MRRCLPFLFLFFLSLSPSQGTSDTEGLALALDATLLTAPNIPTCCRSAVFPPSLCQAVGTSCPEFLCSPFFPRLGTDLNDSPTVSWFGHSVSSHPCACFCFHSYNPGSANNIFVPWWANPSIQCAAIVQAHSVGTVDKPHAR